MSARFQYTENKNEKENNKKDEKKIEGNRNEGDGLFFFFPLLRWKVMLNGNNIKIELNNKT